MAAPTPAQSDDQPSAVSPAAARKSEAPRLLRRFNYAFGLMTIIPILICLYVISERLFAISVLFKGVNSVYFLLALVIALLGLLAGHEVIRDIIRQLVEANAKLLRLSEQQASFVSNVAHEFRSPLAVFKGAMDNMADGLHGPLSDDQMEPVSMCQREANRLSRLVRDLLDITRIEAGRLPLLKDQVDLSALLKTVSEVAGAMAKDRGLGLTLDLPADGFFVTGDRDRLHQVFFNIISNAIKYTEHGRISVTLRRTGDLIQVAVADTGRGIEPKDLERIFDKFERVGIQTEEGSGLGLPIAKDIVKLHQGRIWAESEAGKGSRFIIELPAARPGAAKSAQGADGR